MQISRKSCILQSLASYALAFRALEAFLCACAMEKGTASKFPPLPYLPQQLERWALVTKVHLKLSSKHTQKHLEMLFFYIVRFVYFCSITAAPIYPHYSPPAPATPTSHIQSSPHPLSLSLSPLYVFLCNPYPNEVLKNTPIPVYLENMIITH